MAMAEIISGRTLSSSAIHHQLQWKPLIPPSHRKPTIAQTHPSIKTRKNAVFFCQIDDVGCTKQGFVPVQKPVFGRREGLILIGLIGLNVPASSSLSSFAFAKEVAVGSYLPAASSADGFVQFIASGKDTPALRAGNL